MSRNSASLIGPTVNGPLSSAAFNGGWAMTRPRKSAYRCHHQRGREFLRAGRHRGRRVQRCDERLAFRLATVGVPARGEQLLELVDH
jgi:hypothetical protein